MGYDYTIQGWYKSDRPVDLSAVSSVFHGAPGEPPIDFYARLTGRKRNYVVFATQAKHRSNYYLAVLSAVMASTGGTGVGLVTVTGEITHDGKDRFVIARDGALFTLPTVRLYDPLSPWNAAYHWSHYMARPMEDLVTPDAARLIAKLAGRTSIKGWLYLQDHNTSDADAERIIARIIDRAPDLGGGIAFLKQLSEPYLLFGQQDVDAASAVAVLADVTAESYGMLYCSAGDERSHTPVAFENGRVVVLPELSLAPESEAELLPTSADAYEGLGEGFEMIPVRSALDLHGAARDVMRALHANPVEPHGGWRDEATAEVPCYIFETHGLACFFMNNVFRLHAGWPYVLITYLRGPADPDVLKRNVAELIGHLREAGIECGTDPR
jgi:hypothetical protein